MNIQMKQLINNNMETKIMYIKGDLEQHGSSSWWGSVKNINVKDASALIKWAEHFHGH